MVRTQLIFKHVSVVELGNIADDEREFKMRIREINKFLDVEHAKIQSEDNEETQSYRDELIASYGLSPDINTATLVLRRLVDVFGSRGLGWISDPLQEEIFVPDHVNLSLGFPHDDLPESLKDLEGFI